MPVNRESHDEIMRVERSDLTSVDMSSMLLISKLSDNGNNRLAIIV